jgi:hypothetical protein
VRLAAGAISVLLALGFGVPGVLGLRHFARTGDVYEFLGFPTYGGGPFERMGIDTSVPLLVAFLVVCLAELAVGVAIWMDASGATAAAFALMPAEFLFWIGFGLPVGPILGIARTVLLLVR